MTRLRFSVGSASILSSDDSIVDAMVLCHTKSLARSFVTSSLITWQTGELRLQEMLVRT